MSGYRIYTCYFFLQKQANRKNKWARRVNVSFYLDSSAYLPPCLLSSLGEGGGTLPKNMFSGGRSDLSLSPLTWLKVKQARSLQGNRTPKEGFTICTKPAPRCPRLTGAWHGQAVTSHTWDSKRCAVLNSVFARICSKTPCNRTNLLPISRAS